MSFYSTILIYIGLNVYYPFKSIGLFQKNKIDFYKVIQSNKFKCSYCAYFRLKCELY